MDIAFFNSSKIIYKVTLNTGYWSIFAICCFELHPLRPFASIGDILLLRQGKLFEVA